MAVGYRCHQHCIANAYRLSINMQEKLQHATHAHSCTGVHAMMACILRSLALSTKHLVQLQEPISTRKNKATSAATATTAVQAEFKGTIWCSISPC